MIASDHKFNIEPLETRESGPLRSRGAEKAEPFLVYSFQFSVILKSLFLVSLGVCLLVRYSLFLAASAVLTKADSLVLVCICIPFDIGYSTFSVRYSI
jgi:hypothetical protein